MTKLKTVNVADVLERELEPTIKEWLRRVNLVPELTAVTLSDADRTGHLPKLYSDLISRLRLVEDSYPPISVAAAVHGRKRRVQGYSTSPSQRTRQEPYAFRRNGHCGRGGRTPPSHSQLRGSDSS
jgi:hypothetical protein